MAARELFLGTTNKKKLAELLRLLSPLGFSLKTPDQMSSKLEVDETGSTFLENACLKAVQQAQFHKMFAIGEDSGLCVDALKGAPGIYSARFSGPAATDQSNNELLLEKMKSIPMERRTAHYISSIALASPDGQVLATADGRCFGRILEQPRGVGGFGYDPLFEILEYHQTFAELGGTVKASLSHRARALEKFIGQLKKLEL